MNNTGNLVNFLKFSTLFFLLTLNSHKFAYSADAGGEFLIMGLGNSSCSAFLNEDSQGAAYYMSWLAGYMTSYNHLKEDTYSVLGATKGPLELETWLRDYCTINSTESFESAARNLLRNLQHFRLKSKP